jgi:Sensors of blue-light using FAD
MPSLTHCIYASAATRTFEVTELAEVLKRARENNSRLGLTGMLLYVEGNFFQVLEGPGEVVDAMYDKLLLDKRHDHVTRIISEPIPKRAFDSWTMGFSDVSREELAGIPGVNDFFGKGGCFDKIDAGRAKKLLVAFGEGRWRTKLSGAGQVARA